MKKAFVTLIFTVVFVVSGFSQAKFPDNDQVQKFTSSTTYVVLESSPLGLDGILKEAIEKHWKITPYKFVSLSEYETLKEKPGNPFLLVTTASFEKDENEAFFNFITVVVSDTSGNLSAMPEFVSLPIAYEDDMSVEYAYVIEPAVKFIQHHITNICNQRLMMSLRKLNYYNSNSKEINGAELLLREKHLDPQLTPERADELYEGDLVVASESEFRKKLKEDKPLFVHLVKAPEDVNSNRVIKYVLDPETGKMFYYQAYKSETARPAFVSEYDFNKM